MEEYQESVRNFNLRARKNFERFTPTQWVKMNKGKQVEVEASSPEASDVPEDDSAETAPSDSVETAHSESEEEQPPPRPQKLTVRRNLKAPANDDDNEPTRRVRMKRASNRAVPNAALRRLANDEDTEEPVVPPLRRTTRRLKK